MDTDEEKIRYINNILNDNCKKYKDILSQGNTSKYFETAIKAYELFNNINKNSSFSFEEFYKKYLKDTIIIKSNLYKIIPFFRKKLIIKVLWIVLIMINYHY